MLDEEFEKNWRELSGANLLHKKLENCSVLDTFLYRVSDYRQVILYLMWCIS